MYPLYWTTSKGGIFMRYSYEFKSALIGIYMYVYITIKKRLTIRLTF